MWSRNRTASRAPRWERQTQSQQSRRKRRRARMQLPLRIRCSQMPAATWLRYDFCSVSACVSMPVSTAASKSRWIHPFAITPRCTQEVPRLRCRRELACKSASWLTLRSICCCVFLVGALYLIRRLGRCCVSSARVDRSVAPLMRMMTAHALFQC
jgi:hypothetical protein